MSSIPKARTLPSKGTFQRLVRPTSTTSVPSIIPSRASAAAAKGTRGRRVYIDCLQNVLGKTLATAYSARASTYAGVSTPLTWDEVDRGVRREDFTMATLPARLRDVGDLWRALRTSKGVDLSRVSKYSARKAR